MIARYNLQVLIALLVVAVLASAIGIVHARYRHRQLFTELSRLEKTRDALNIEFSRLQLEQATWAESSRIDKVARDRLGMRTPDPVRDIVVVRP